MPVTLEIDGLFKSYGTVEALRGISLRVGDGERLGLLGPNGAGKTTLIRCLCGLTAPDRGSMRLLGQRLPTRGGRQALGLVPQEIALYRDLTARENLTAFGRYHGLRGRQLRQRIQWALEWTGLTEQQSAIVDTFSGGMKRRVNIACGVLHQPRVVLLDEPTVGVDPQSRQRIFAMLDSLRGGGTSILLTTHHLDEAESQCDRIVILDRGCVAAEGTLAELVARTVGPARQVRLQVEQPLRGPIAGWHADSQGSGLVAKVDDVAGQLPALLHGVRSAGYSVADVEVHSPSLHHVFLHLTGHALRD